MTSEDIIKYINEPESLNRDSFARLKVFIEKYPYFQTARTLIMRNIKELEPKSLKKYLSENTIYISDRQRIYSYLHPKQLEEIALFEKDVQDSPPDSTQKIQTPIIEQEIVEQEIEKTTPPAVADAPEQKIEIRIKKKDKRVAKEDKTPEKEDLHFHNKIVDDFFKEKTMEHTVLEEIAQKEGKDTTFKIEIKRRPSRNAKKTQRVKAVNEAQKESTPKKKIVLNKKSKEDKPIQNKEIIEVNPRKKVIVKKIKEEKIEQKQEIIPPENIESNKNKIDEKLAQDGAREKLPSSKKEVLKKKKKIETAKKSAISNDVFGKIASLQGISLNSEKRKQQKKVLELQQKQIDAEQQKINEQRKEAASKIKNDEIKAKNDIAKVNNQAKEALQEKLVKQKEAEEQKAVAQEELHKQKEAEAQKVIEQEKLHRKKEAEKQKAVAQEELRKQKVVEEQKNIEEEKLRKEKLRKEKLRKEKEAEKQKAVAQEELRLQKEEEAQKIIEQEKLRLQKEAKEQEKLNKKPKESAADALIRRIAERKTKEPVKTKKSLIDDFIKNEPKIDRNNELKNSGDLSIESTLDQGTIVSETLANLLVNQKEYDKAIEAFLKLAQQKPLKKDSFEQRIQEIKKLMAYKSSDF